MRKQIDENRHAVNLKKKTHNGVFISESATLTAIFGFDNKSETIFVFPFEAARCNGVAKYLSCAFKSAP